MLKSSRLSLRRRSWFTPGSRSTWTRRSRTTTSSPSRTRRSRVCAGRRTAGGRSTNGPPSQREVTRRFTRVELSYLTCTLHTLNSRMFTIHGALQMKLCLFFCQCDFFSPVFLHDSCSIQSRLGSVRFGSGRGFLFYTFLLSFVS